MKKRLTTVLFILFALSVLSCGKKTTETEKATPGGAEREIPSEIEEEFGDWADFGLDAASLDIDNDGVNEDCRMIPGPTSGLFSIIIEASVNGKIKYLNTFVLNPGEMSFAEKDGIPQIVRDSEYHRLYVKDHRIMIENLDPEFEGYWGGSDWNFDLK